VRSTTCRDCVCGRWRCVRSRPILRRTHDPWPSWTNGGDFVGKRAHWVTAFTADDDDGDDSSEDGHDKGCGVGIHRVGHDEDDEDDAGREDDTDHDGHTEENHRYTGAGAGHTSRPNTDNEKASVTSATRRTKADAGGTELAVRADESPWTPAELDEQTTVLRAERTRLIDEIAEADKGLADLLLDSADSSGDDTADSGGKTFDREHELSLANNTRELLEQVERALGRIDDGTYGSCESCGNPIGKARLQAFPRATLCVPCKQREERR